MPSRMYYQDIFHDPMLSSAGNGSLQLSATWGNLRKEVAENSLSSNDPFVSNLNQDPAIKFLPTKNVQQIQNNPEMFKETIVGLDASTDGTRTRVEEFACFEAGPLDKIKWRWFNIPKYGSVLGFTAPSNMAPWIKFKLLSTDKTNRGNFAANRIWELIGIPCDLPSDPSQATLDITETQEKAILKRKIQVVSVLRPAKRLKFQKNC